MGIARTFQEPRTFPGMTALEFVSVAAMFGSRQQLTRAEARQRASELLAACGDGAQGSPAKHSMMVKWTPSCATQYLVHDKATSNVDGLSGHVRGAW